jgi:hypothetical protein
MPESTTQNQDQATATPEQSEEVQRMEAWVAKGLGAHPYVGSREEWDKLPDIARAEISEVFAEHAEWLTADPNKLPAEVRLRMAKQELLLTDQQALEDAGYFAAVQYLGKVQQQAMQAAWDASIEAGQAEMAANTIAREKEWAASQAASLERSNAAARANYLRQLHAGTGIEQPTGPVRIAS